MNWKRQRSKNFGGDSDIKFETFIDTARKELTLWLLTELPGGIGIVSRLTQILFVLDQNHLMLKVGSGESGGSQGIPYWAKLGFSSEAEYLASLNKDEEQEPEYVNPLSKLSPRIAGSRFAADGGRIGFQEGGGIEQRLEKLGGDVSSAEKMLQGINQRLKTAESSLGSGGAWSWWFTTTKVFLL